MMHIEINRTKHLGLSFHLPVDQSRSKPQGVYYFYF